MRRPNQTAKDLNEEYEQYFAGDLPRGYYKLKHKVRLTPTERKVRCYGANERRRYPRFTLEEIEGKNG